MLSVHIDTARGWRGGQNQALLTVLGLRELGHRTVLVCHPDGELRRRASEGLDVVPLAATNEMSLAAGWKLSRVFADLQPDVVHAHDPRGVAMASMALALGASNDGPPLIASRRVDFRLRRNALSRWKYRQVNRFICASNAIRSLLVADGIPEDRTVTVHEGIDLAHVEAMPALNIHKELWLPTDVPVIGNIAALVPHKGQRHLISAAAIVRQQVPDAHLVILGEGELRETLERQIKHLNLEKHVLLVGFRPDALAYLKSFDIFVMSSLMEGLGTSVLDAMACARPVVATRAGGIPEVVTEAAATLVPPKDDQAMAREILALLDDPARRARMGEAGRAHVRAHFSAQRMVLETLDVYEDVVGRFPAADTGNHPGSA